MANDGERSGPRRTSLPLPPPEREDRTSRVRFSLSSLAPETAVHDVPALPFGVPWDADEDTEEEEGFDGVTAAVTPGRLDELRERFLAETGIGTLAEAPRLPKAPPPAPAAPRPEPPDLASADVPELVAAASDRAEHVRDRATVAGLKRGGTARRVQLPPLSTRAKAATAPPPPGPIALPPPPMPGTGATPPAPGTSTPAAPASPAAPAAKPAKAAAAPAASGKAVPSARLPLLAEPSGAHPMPRPPPRKLRPPSTAERPERSVAGRYKIVERIGQGGMGKVYKVSHTQLGKVFALKVIGGGMADTDDARALFYREARLASAVNHPNITSVVDFGEDAELGAFMVMELVEGEPLARILHRETRLGVRMACEIILQVADALHYVHGKGIVHCDIKTENILVSEQAGTKRRQMVVKLLDFGLARSLTSGRSSGTLSGTPHYVAPERIRGGDATPSSDIYALGILFYEIVTGHVPWDGPVANILQGHLEQDPTPPSTLVPGGIDPALENLILHALAKDPAKRHKDMAALIYELRTVMDMLGFGRRRRGGSKRVIIERSQNERDALASRALDHCRLPLALISSSGLVVVANAAFARFVMGIEVEVEGLTVQSTPLVGAWTSFAADLAKAVAGTPVRQVLEIEQPDQPPQRLLLWLDPAGEHVLLGAQPIELP